MKSPQSLGWSLMLACSLCLSSCFDILEVYTFRSDGSGSAEMKIDLTDLVSLMAPFSSMDSTGDYQRTLDEMFQDNSSVETLSQLEGIRNVRSLNDQSMNIIGFAYEFDNIQSLNNAMAANNTNSAMMELGLRNEEEGAENHFEMKGNTIRRVVVTPAPSEEDASEDKEMMAMAFENASYDIRYNFDCKIKKVKGNKLAEVGPDGKTVNIHMALTDMLNQKSSPSCSVTLKSK